MEPAETRPETGFPHRATRVLADLAALLRFFSRLPVPAVNRLDDPAALPVFARAGALAPLAGILLSLPACAALLLLGQTALPPAAVGLVAICLAISTTGALHEDGLADVADGFFGGSHRERRLEIMKDSRIGAFGALSLIVSIGLRVTLLAALLERLGPATASLTLLSVEACSRAAMIMLWSALPPARSGGLAATCGRPGRSAATGAVLLSLVTAVPLVSIIPDLMPAALVGLALAILSSLALGALARAKIGGQTGDVLGAAQQVSMLALLTGFVSGLPTA